jgi:hypothetical protein
MKSVFTGIEIASGQKRKLCKQMTHSLEFLSKDGSTRRATNFTRNGGESNSLDESRRF